MKNCLLFLAFFVLTTTGTLSAQRYGTAADTFGFIDIVLKNLDDSPYAGQKVVLKSNKGHTVEVKTDAQGKVKATVPFDAVYRIYCGEHQCRDTVIVQNFPYVTHKFQGYSSRGMILKFHCKSPNGQPLDGEVLKIENEKGEMQEVVMGPDGRAELTLPMQNYRIHANYLPYVHTVQAKPDYERHIVTIPMTWIGTKEMERRAFVADSLSRAAHAAAIALLDSLIKLEPVHAIKTFVEEDYHIPLYRDTATVERLIAKKAEAYKAAFAKNPKVFEEKGKIVLAALTRIAPKVPNGIVVTDVTGSMSPYMEQVLLWHALNFTDGKTTRYVFFNDGDARPDGPVGKSGGLYHCSGTIKDFKNVIGSIVRAASAGYGGDAPENDIEAILGAHAKNGAKGTEPIILIADNFSPVRDLSLLDKVKVPVHVIVCGLGRAGLSCSGYVHEHYLEIARRTGGSIHTIEQDLFDLSKRREGETLRINGVDYILQGGAFRLKG